jgi:ribonuclease P protein component
VFALANDVGYCRLGLTVTRRTGTAVARNRIKRILRDAFRRHGKEFPGSMDLVINAYAPLLRMPPERIRRELVDAVGELARKLDR